MKIEKSDNHRQPSNDSTEIEYYYIFINKLIIIMTYHFWKACKRMRLHCFISFHQCLVHRKDAGLVPRLCIGYGRTQCFFVPINHVSYVCAINTPLNRQDIRNSAAQRLCISLVGTNLLVQTPMQIPFLLARD